MTSVPKPLKFLRQYYTSLKEVYETMADKSNKVYLFTQRLRPPGVR